MKDIKVFIVEDELIHAEALKISINEAGFKCIGECNNADEAFVQIQKAMPDVVLVDIALPGLNNGITLSQEIHEKLGIPHIFTTSFTHDQIIEQAAASKPAGYLRKPVDTVNLKAAIKIALSNNEVKTKQENNSTNNDSLFVRIGDKLHRVNINDILILKADGDNCISLVLEEREFICRSTLKELSKQLPSFFIQVHRSYCINLNHLDSFNERQQTAFLKGKNAPVARSFRKHFLQAINKI